MSLSMFISGQTMQLFFMMVNAQIDLVQEIAFRITAESTFLSSSI